jgi:hypothetical protein
MLFMYYLPGVAASDVTRESLQAGPLAELFWDLLRSPALYDARVRTFTIHANGPDGMSGVIVAAMPAAGLQGPPPGVRPGQTWIQIKAGPDGEPLPAPYWLGFDGETPPGPMDLQREHLVQGVEHELGDGRIWMCPIVRRRGVANALPSRWGVDPETGEFASTLLPRYAAAWEASRRILDAQISGEIERPEVLALCVQMLAINYRIGVHETSLLGLLDETTWKEVWRAATDAARLEEWISNQAQDGVQKKE